MNYGDIERQVFRTFLAFASLMLMLLLLFFNINRNIYRVSEIVYDTSVQLNTNSLEKLKGSSIWLIDDAYYDAFYKENPSVERIIVQKEFPNTLLVQINFSEKIAFIQDNGSRHEDHLYYLKIYIHVIQPLMRDLFLLK